MSDAAKREVRGEEPTCFGGAARARSRRSPTHARAPPPRRPRRPQIQELLKFMGIKRDLFVSEAEAIFRDFNDERCVDAGLGAPRSACALPAAPSLHRALPRTRARLQASR